MSEFGAENVSITPFLRVQALKRIPKGAEAYFLTKRHLAAAQFQCAFLESFPCVSTPMIKYQSDRNGLRYSTARKTPSHNQTAQPK